MQLECAHNGLVGSRQAGDLIESNLCIVSVLPSCAVGNIIMSQAHVKDPNTGKEGIFYIKAAGMKQHMTMTNCKSDVLHYITDNTSQYYLIITQISTVYE